MDTKTSTALSPQKSVIFAWKICRPSFTFTRHRLIVWVCFCAALENRYDTRIVPKQTNPRTSGLSVAGPCTVSFAKLQHKSEASGGSCVSLPTSLSNNVKTSRFKSLCLHTHAVLAASNRRTDLHCLHSHGWWPTKDENWQHAASHFSCFHITHITTNLGTGLKSLWWSGRHKYNNKMLLLLKKTNFIVWKYSL